MPDTLQKLQPDRDLQCYFLIPSSIAAISQASATGFTVSGTWRQQFDWAVVEWNRDNVFEHPALRNLPDGDLSGLHLSYEETRENCIPMDSKLFPTVDWPTLRVWEDSTGVEKIYAVPLFDHATAIAGSYAPASVVFHLGGTPTSGDYVEVAWLDEHYNFPVAASLSDAVAQIGAQINAHSTTMVAAASGTQLTVTFADSTTGANGNRVGAYASVRGAGTESWSPGWQQFSGGTSPSQWRVDLDFGALSGWLIDDPTHTIVPDFPTTSVRKLRWTYAADFQLGAYARSEYQATVSNWTVTGTGRAYQVAGSESRRIEDDSSDLAFTGSWSDPALGNFSGGSIRYTSAPAASVSYTYAAPQAHCLYVGTRRADSATTISIVIDGAAPRTVNLLLSEDVLVRVLVAELAGGAPHTVTVSHGGSSGEYFYFDFFEIAVPVADLPVAAPDDRTTLATDWDTYHSQSLPAERTAWLIRTLGFTGRANHYVGALWFYELIRQGHVYASATVTFSGTPVFSETSEISITIDGSATNITHLHLYTDTAATVAKAFELIINNGFTAIRASASGGVLSIYARAMGAVGNSIGLNAFIVTPGSGETFSVVPSASSLSGGADGNWRTDLTTVPRINRAARDWSQAYYTALRGYGIDVAAAFSMELQHGDPDVAAGIAQRYSNGDPVQLNTPALQTNFSPTSAAFWQQVHLDMADIMAAAGCVPYLQFGEVQWWYFVTDWDWSSVPYPVRTHDSLPFYDAYTTATFTATYGGAMHVFASAGEDPSAYPHESSFLPGLIGTFTSQIMSFVRATHSNARFEVLYPPDTNDSPVDRVTNLPASWTPASLDCFKTENFTFTGGRDMNKAETSILLPTALGFPASQSSHLVGIGDYRSPWMREARMSKAQGVESVVLFALDQFCLIGYPAPLARSPRRCRFMSY